MPRSPRARSRRPPGNRDPRNAGADALAAATLDAAIIYWRWLGEEFPRYAKAVSSELSGLKGRRVSAKEAAVRIVRLTQEYAQVLSDLPQRILEQVDGSARVSGSPGSRRRQGRVID
jgi:hypothetical protein